MGLATHLLAIVGRVAAIYVVLFAMLRMVGRRELAELSPMDLLTMLLVSETVSPALTGGDTTLLGGFVAAGSLMGLTVLSSIVVFRSRTAERVIEGRSSLLIEHGKINLAVLRQERITDDALKAKLHENGLLSADGVAYAFLESDGAITIIKEKDLEGRTRPG